MALVTQKGLVEDGLVRLCASGLAGRSEGVRVVLFAGDSIASRQAAFDELIAGLANSPRTVDLDLSASSVAPSRWPDTFRELMGKAHGRGTPLSAGVGLGCLEPVLTLLEALAPGETQEPIGTAQLASELARVSAVTPLVLRFRHVDRASYLWLSLLGTWARAAHAESQRLLFVLESGAAFGSDDASGPWPLRSWLLDIPGATMTVKLPAQPAESAAFALGSRVPKEAAPGGRDQALQILHAGAALGEMFPIRPVLDALGITADDAADKVVDALDDTLADDDGDDAVLEDVGAKAHVFEPLMAYRFRTTELRDIAASGPGDGDKELATRLADALLRRVPRRAPSATMLVAALRLRAGQPERAAEVLTMDLWGQPVEVLEDLHPELLLAILTSIDATRVVAAGWAAVRAVPPLVGVRVLDVLARALGTTADPSPQLKALELVGRGHVLSAMMQAEQALELNAQARAHCTEKNLADWELPLLAQTARCHLLLRDAEQAARAARSYMIRAETLKQRSHVGRAKMELAAAQLLERDGKAAMASLNEALGAFKQASDKGGQADVHMQLAQAVLAQKDPKKADEHLAQAAKLAQEGGAALTFVMAQRQRGRMRLVPQGAAEAVPLLQNAAQVAGQIGQLPLAADTLEDLATAQIMQSQARPAQEALIQALRLREALRHVPGQARVLSRLGLAFLMANDHAQADKALDRSLELAPEGDSAIQAAQLKGLVAMQQNRVDEAAPHMERAIALAEKSGAKETQATLMHNLAFVKEKQGNAAAADALRERARELAPGVSPQPNTLSVSFPPIAGDGGPSTTG